MLDVRIHSYKEGSIVELLAGDGLVHSFHAVSPESTDAILEVIQDVLTFAPSFNGTKVKFMVDPLTKSRRKKRKGK